MTVKDRRKALGWDRAELARRARVDRAVLQLIELDQWTEGEDLQRVREVLDRTEAGEADVVLADRPAPP
ncbi:MAG: helix-turn-helix domain-containing protein [Myxococcota bacterium]